MDQFPIKFHQFFSLFYLLSLLYKGSETFPFQLHRINADMNQYFISVFCYDSNCMICVKAGCNRSASRCIYRIALRNDGKSIAYHLLGKCCIPHFRDRNQASCYRSLKICVLSSCTAPCLFTARFSSAAAFSTFAPYTT